MIEFVWDRERNCFVWHNPGLGGCNCPKCHVQAIQIVHDSLRAVGIDVPSPECEGWSKAGYGR